MRIAGQDRRMGNAGQGHKKDILDKIGEWEMMDKITTAHQW